MKHSSPYKFLEAWEKEISMEVDKVIKERSSPDFLFLSDRDGVFLKKIFMAGYIKAHEKRSVK